MNTTPDLTRRQAEVLDYLCSRWSDPPTIREMCDDFGVTITRIVGHLTRLEAKGYIECPEMPARSIRVLRSRSLDGDEVEIMGRQYRLTEIGGHNGDGGSGY